jgi:hypothetical protein
VWKSRNKTELMIEVWEKLDCESVGASEIEAIEVAVADVFGKSAVESPMKIARLLADEGAELRHSEIMELYLKRAAKRIHEPAVASIREITDLRSTLDAIRQMETLRQKFKVEGDADGARTLRLRAIAEKDHQLQLAQKARSTPDKREQAAEAAEWIRLWIQSPEHFENWIKLRCATADFIDKFGKID